MYDEKCEELARHFIDGGDEIYTEENIRELAQLIQITIEDWLSFKESPDYNE